MCSMLAAALGSMSAPALIGSTAAIIASTATTTLAQSSDGSREKAATLRLMSKPITLDVEDQPLIDILQYISDVTEAELEPIYLDSLASIGMDPDTPITLRVENIAAITVLDRVLKKAERTENIGEEFTWQFTDIGTIECGPKTALNENSRIELYDIADLLLVIPQFDNAPEFNIQGGGGAGGGQSPFQGSSGDVQIESAAERSGALIGLIESTIESEQWANNGGDGATVTLYGTSLVINAPDYIHRQIAGYDFWPARLQTIRTRGNQRSIQIKPDPKARTSP